MFKRNISFYKRKKEITTKTWTLNERKVYIKRKGKVHIINLLDKGKVDSMDFLEYMQIFLNTGSW